MRAEEIARRLGGRRSGAGWSARCPAHQDRSPSLSIGESASGRLLLHCHAGCSFERVIAALGGGIAPIHRRGHVDDRDAGGREAEAERRRFAALRIWNRARSGEGALVERYLRARAIGMPVPSALRFAPNLRHPSGGAAPAMVAAIRDRGGPLVGVHRTWLRPDGLGKAALSPAKAMLGRALGSAVRLSEAGSPLIIGEGIETTLSVCDALPHACGWAALSTSGLAALDLPTTLGDLVIAADGDPAGRRAAVTLADRAVACGWRVRVLNAPDGLDWNDVAMCAAREARHDAQL